MLMIIFKYNSSLATDDHSPGKILSFSTFWFSFLFIIILPVQLDFLAVTSNSIQGVAPRGMTKMSRTSHLTLQSLCLVVALNERLHFQKVNKSWGRFIMKLCHKILEKSKNKIFYHLKTITRFNLIFFCFQQNMVPFGQGMKTSPFFLFICYLVLYLDYENKWDFNRKCVSKIIRTLAKSYACATAESKPNSIIRSNTEWISASWCCVSHWHANVKKKG